ncbi:AAA family ATPase [Sphingomonas sp.]|uniref:AAA family ATPase n=1 Tax=Sphingomonas sp. TaxID=28214 RepID=UPI0025DB39F5|nr:AAA family ATPase [Sphingomonas sp.]MBV9528527.1 AAA family ATPase [Sphingomonas sp.]
MTATPLRERFDKAEPFAPAQSVPPTPFAVERFRDIKPQLEGLWLVKRLIPADGQVVIHGHPNCGKSFFAVDMGLHVALGWDWHGRRTKAGLVIYVGAEGRAGLKNRIVAFQRHHNVTDAPFALLPSPIDMQAPDADVSRLAETIRREAAHFDVRPAMIVLDTLSKTFGAGKENTDDMATYVANCGRIAAEFQCCVVIVHHRPKDAESEEPRGHSSLKGGVDTVILVEEGSTKSARVMKQRDGELGSSILFTLKSIELGHDEDGDFVTSCVVQAADIDDRPKSDPLALAIARLPDSAKLALRQLEEAIKSDGTPPPQSIPDAEINRARVGKVVLLKAWRDKAIMAAGTDRDNDRDTGKRSFNRALQRLQKDDIVRVWGEFAWRNWGASGTDRDIEPGQTGTPGQPGHRSLDLSRLSRPHVADDRSQFPHGNPALQPIEERDPFNDSHWDD